MTPPPRAIVTSRDRQPGPVIRLPMSVTPTSATITASTRRSSMFAASDPTTAPTASQPVRGTLADHHEIAQLVERLLAEQATRPELVDCRERRLVARGQDLLGRGGSDPGQRLELSLRRMVEVDLGPAARSSRSRWRITSRRAPGCHRIVARRDPDLGSISEGRRKVELLPGSDRVDAGPVAAGGRDQIADT